MTMHLRHRSPAEQRVWLDDLDRQASTPGPLPAHSDAARWRAMTPEARAFTRAMFDEAYDEPQLNTPGSEREYVRSLIDEHALNQPRARALYNNDAGYHRTVHTVERVLTAAHAALTSFYGIPSYLIEAVLIRIILRTLGPEPTAEAEKRAAVAAELRETFDLIDRQIDTQCIPEYLEKRLREIKARVADVNDEPDS